MAVKKREIENDLPCECGGDGQVIWGFCIKRRFLSFIFFYVYLKQFMLYYFIEAQMSVCLVLIEKICIAGSL